MEKRFNYSAERDTARDLYFKAAKVIDGHPESSREKTVPARKVAGGMRGEKWKELSWEGNEKKDIRLVVQKWLDENAGRIEVKRFYAKAECVEKFFSIPWYLRFVKIKYVEKEVPFAYTLTFKCRSRGVFASSASRLGVVPVPPIPGAIPAFDPITRLGLPLKGTSWSYHIALWKYDLGE